MSRRRKISTTCIAMLLAATMVYSPVYAANSVDLSADEPQGTAMVGELSDESVDEAASEDGILHGDEVEGSMFESEVQSKEYNIEIYSNRHTQPEKDLSVVENRLDLEGYELKAENDKLEVWFREAIYGIRIRVKETGYVWGSLQADAQEGDNKLNQSWSEMANAFCTFEYFDEKGNAKKLSAMSAGVDKEMKWTEDGFTCGLDFKEASITMTVKMTLDDDHIRFEAVDQPEETGAFMAKSLYFMPFLGTVPNAEIPGYMFLPDGPGALIRFREKAQYVSTFDKKVYGKDFGVDPSTEVVSLGAQRPDDYLVAEPQVLMPVYGMAHGAEQNAFFARIASGAEYASIQGNVAISNMPFNWAAARFDYRQLYMQPVNRTGSGVQSPQKDANVMNPSISFYFLTGKDADYVGMAQKYKEILTAEGVLKPLTHVNESIPLRVDLLGSDIKWGFLSKTNIAFTTIKQASEIVATLADNGIDNLTMIYEGWQKGGVNGSKKAQTGVDGKLGSMSAMHELRDTVNEKGQFFLAYSPVQANENQLNLYRQSATTLSKSYMSVRRENKEIPFQEYFLLRPELVMANIDKVLGANEEMDFALNQAGALLYADNTRGKEVTRTETMEMFDQIAVKAYKTPNAYLWDTTEVYLDIPTVNSQYLFESDTVPFMQIVLKGNIEYYNPYINIGAFSRNSLLKMLEYGTYPSFILTGVQSSVLKDTPQEDMFSTYYADWMPTIVEMYGVLNEVLSQVADAEIMDHQALSEGVAVTTYSNGVRVFVNYGTSDYVYADEGITVPAQSYEVKGV